MARILGIRGDGATDDPVISGSRALSLKSDDSGSSTRSRSGPFVDPRLADRMAAGRAREERERAAARDDDGIDWP